MDRRSKVLDSLAFLEESLGDAFVVVGTEYESEADLVVRARVQTALEMSLTLLGWAKGVVTEHE